MVIEGCLVPSDILTKILVLTVDGSDAALAALLVCKLVHRKLLANEEFWKRLYQTIQKPSEVGNEPFGNAGPDDTGCFHVSYFVDDGRLVAKNEDGESCVFFSLFFFFLNYFSGLKKDAPKAEANYRDLCFALNSARKLDRLISKSPFFQNDIWYNVGLG
jgi:hypothetical protein